jgi:hypothetical protein
LRPENQTSPVAAGLVWCWMARGRATHGVMVIVMVIVMVRVMAI